ncbi:MAG: M48 family metallopeptidase [Pseudomonadota bacterium]
MIQGRYFDTHSSAAGVAQLEAVALESVCLHVNGQRQMFGLAQLEISDRIGSIPRRLRFPDASEFETDDNDGVDALLGAAAPRQTWVHRLERNWGIAVGALVGVVAVSFLFVRFGLPVVAGWVAAVLPPSTDNIIGQHAIQILDHGFLKPSTLDAQRQANLHNLFSRMTASLNDGHDYRLELRDSPALGPNAVALPAGIVVMTDQLSTLAANDEELMAVLAHEIGHVRGRHALRQMIEGVGISAIAVVILGDMSSVTALASAAPVLLQSRNSRQLESEADAFSRQWLRDNHIPEQRFDDILCRMIGPEDKKGAQLPPFLATHPAIQDRAHCPSEGK